MVEEINPVQKLQLELMRLASFNYFDGGKVVDDIVCNKGLWRGVVMDGEPENKRINLIKLRDIEDGLWNVDTVFILPEEGRERELEELARTWGADEVGWITRKEAQDRLRSWGREYRILRIWWD